jgi:hypothetical protein
LNFFRILTHFVFKHRQEVEVRLTNAIWNAYLLQQCATVDPGAEVQVYQLEVTTERETRQKRF